MSRRLSSSASGSSSPPSTKSHQHISTCPISSSPDFQRDSYYDKLLEDQVLEFSQWYDSGMMGCNLSTARDRSEHSPSIKPTSKRRPRSLFPLLDLEACSKPVSAQSRPQKERKQQSQRPPHPTPPQQSNPHEVVVSATDLRYQYIPSRDEVRGIFKENCRKGGMELDEAMVELGRKVMVEKVKREGLWDGSEDEVERRKGRRRFYGEE